MDIAAIGSLLSSLKTATDIAKFIRESDLSLERAELKLKLAELVEALAGAKLEAANVQQELLDRDERIRELLAAAKVRAQIKWAQPCYYMPNDQGIDEPYCQNCYDSSSSLSRLHTDGNGFFQCRVCKQSYKTQERAIADKAKADAAVHGRGGGWMARCGA
jgi:hypothetical protein